MRCLFAKMGPVTKWTRVAVLDSGIKASGRTGIGVNGNIADSAGTQNAGHFSQRVGWIGQVMENGTRKHEIKFVIGKI